jgi:uncharacterized protein YkwD
MKILRTSLLAIVFMFAVSSCTKDESEVLNEANHSIDLNLAHETNWVFADEILDLINKHRDSLDLSAISRDQQYASAYAVEHTKYMIEMNQINHDNFNIRSAALKDNGAYTVAENVAFGYNSAEDVVRAWLNSPSHRRIIEGSYSHSGFGVISNNDGSYFFTQLFYSK